jgi:hypothetical protein
MLMSRFNPTRGVLHRTRETKREMKKPDGGAEQPGVRLKCIIAPYRSPQKKNLNLRCAACFLLLCR